MDESTKYLNKILGGMVGFADSLFVGFSRVLFLDLCNGILYVRLIG